MPNESLWYGTAWLVGQAGFDEARAERESFDWPGTLTPGVQVTIRNPERLYNPEDGHIIRHRIDFICEGQAQALRRIAEPTLEQISDLLSFHSLCPTRIKIEPYSRNPPPIPGTTYSAISFGEPRRSSRLDVPMIEPTVVLSMLRQPVMLDTNKRNRVMRALRWQRRAMLANEPVVSFSHFAFALEAIAPCLEGVRGDDQSKRLRSFATTNAGITENMWKRVGRLRHALFHGGIDETSDTIQDADWCADVASHALVVALKQILGLSASALPQVPQLQHGQLRDASMESNGFVRPHPPDRLW